MPLYRFRLTGQDQETPVDLPDDDAAWAQVRALCGEILTDVNANLPSGADWQITATDHRGQDVGSIRIVASRRQRPLS
ncbi:conserved hypothetical protein [Ancylobacter novellus DSM 506]|uniref:DUF6894 domain-containing protein n=1 Tax=Ancylobacter novellus (strain ATCC 8093 / DSM 506 / JCM 20403 / CCM 1077 / IAM 12100 / NBRC 12443 / NCIMB 10456) TaxID=639283 RepID=D7A5I6_ANCN5|nr:conserved hypothetical protein [Ancylobacter novellus DSM 506]